MYYIRFLTLAMVVGVCSGRTKFRSSGLNCEVPSKGRTSCLANNVCVDEDCCYDNYKPMTYWCFKPWEYEYGHEDQCHNLLENDNWDFEEPLGTEWRAHTCEIEISDIALTGRQSGRAFNRINDWSGLRKSLTNLDLNTNYYYSCFISVRDNNPIYTAQLVYLVRFLNGSTATQRLAFNDVYPWMTNKWIHFAGILKTPAFEINYLEVYISIPPEVNYLLDAVALQKLEADPDWKQKASDRIQEIRKNDVTLRGSVPEIYNYEDIHLVVTQTKHEFGFGSSVHVDTFNDPAEVAYRDFFFDNFERATINSAVKWIMMEPQRDNFNFERVDTALETLDAAGIPVHGQNVFWNNLLRNPNWMKNLTGADMKEALNHRVQSVVPKYAGRFGHWDVCSEMITNTYYEEATGNHDILLDMFKNVSLLDPNTDLFLNEYQIFTDPGNHMSGLNNLVRYLVGNGAKLDGLGLKNHHYTRPDIEAVQKRIDFVAQTGLSLYVSGLIVIEPDVTIRADILDDLLHVFFSDSRIKAVTHHGFVDHLQFGTSMSLADGTDVVINEAGQRWHDLVKVVWRTNGSYNLVAPNFEINFSAFHGEYRLQVYNDTTLLTDTTFDLPSGADKIVDVQFCVFGNKSA